METLDTYTAKTSTGLLTGNKQKSRIKIIRVNLAIFIVLLALSGITAFPLQWEMNFLMEHLNWFPVSLQNWIMEVKLAVDKTPQLMFYGTDWLAFAHIIIALFFIPVYMDPQRYRANLLVAMAACLLVFMLAFVCGPLRGIPFFHQLIDCSFGFFAFWPLFIVYRLSNPNNTIL